MSSRGSNCRTSRPGRPPLQAVPAEPGGPGAGPQAARCVQPIAGLIRNLLRGDRPNPLGHHSTASGDVGPGHQTVVAQTPEGQQNPDQTPQTRQTRQQPQAAIPGLHHLQVLGGNNHDHRHRKGTEFGRVGADRGQGQGALAQRTVGRMLLQQANPSARPVTRRPSPCTPHFRRRSGERSGLDAPAKRSSSSTLVVGANGSRKRHPGCNRARRSAVSSRNGMPTLNLAGLDPGSRPTHSPSGNGSSRRAKDGEIRHQITDHAASGLVTDRQLRRTASDIAAIRSFQPGQRATHSA